MDISKLLTGLIADDDTEVVDERSHAAKSREAHLIGLGRIRIPSNGSMRRSAVRDRAREARKETKRRTRLVMQNRHARANLQGQMNVLANPAYPTAQAYIADHLAARYGSAAAAVEHAQRIELDVPQAALDYVGTLP